MNSFLYFRSSQAFVNKLGIFPLLIMLIAFSSVAPSFGQGSEIFKCPESPYTFTGNPEQTLCEQYPNFLCDIQIGAGTPFPTSSSLGAASLSGNICIVGNFEVDVPFTFQNAVVKIRPGVTIAVKPSPNGYDPGSSLGIDNSKLFACSGLWKGITIGHLSTIGTSNGSKIEDAEKAIYASGLCALTIQHTTFNRNRIGLELDTPFPSIFAPGPIVWGFSANKFSCDAPLNGTANEISEAGVKLKNSSLFTFQSGLNRFDDLKYGIYAEGNASQIGASHFYMRRIKKDGIYMKEGLINLSDSWFYDGDANGINIGTAKSVNVKNTQFVTLSNNFSSEYRTGIYIGGFALNAAVTVDDIAVSADMEGTTNKVRGINLQSSSSAAGTKINISNSKFWIRAKNSQGIFMFGIFPESSSTEIWGNSFKISNTTANAGSGRPSGIETDGGDKNNLSIKWNTFTSYAVHTLPPGQIGPPQWNYGLYLRNNTFGKNNEISVNGFNYEVQSMQFGLIVSGFQNAKYCSNSLSGHGLVTGVLFQAICTGTDFVGNTFDFAGYDALLIDVNTQINIQSHKGNEWHNLLGVEPLFHARCLGDPSLNKFVVHTPQSTCTNENDPCFSKYHPRNIESAGIDEFFDFDPFGTPSEGCNDEFAGGGTDELDRRIAQGTFVAPANDPAMGWVLQRYLYHKLKDNPELRSEHISFPLFVADKENTTVGKFYEVHTAIENALQAGTNVDEPSRQALSGINDLMGSMAGVDEAIEQQGLTETLKQQKQNLIFQLHGLNWVYDSLRTIYEAQLVANLQSVYNMNQAITTTQAYETNEKSVNQIRLLSIMEHGGELTENQVVALQSIAQQDPKQGGPAVHTALGMLQECAKPEIPEQNLVTPYAELMEYDQISVERNTFGASPKDASISVSPNPASTSFTIRNPLGYAGTFALLDASGRTWLRQSFSEQELQVELKAGTPSGLFFLRFEMEDAAPSFEKLIIQSR